MMKLLLLSVLVAHLGGQSVPAPADCDSTVDGASVRVHIIGRISGDDANMPVGDWIPLHDADALVTCGIGEDGGLNACKATLADSEGKPTRDDRATWIAHQVQWRYKLLDLDADGCPLAGRQIRFTFHFDMEFPPRVWEVEQRPL